MATDGLIGINSIVPGFGASRIISRLEVHDPAFALELIGRTPDNCMTLPRYRGCGIRRVGGIAYEYAL